MNVYDFDKTIYEDDCATDFYFFILKKNPRLILKWPKLLSAFVKFKQNKINRTQLKEVLYQYVVSIDNLQSEVEKFWSSHEHKIKEWYLDQKQADDLIVSASPEFLIRVISEQLNVNFIASKLNPETGIYDGLNCYGDEKVVRFNQAYPQAHIHQFYSDSYSDTPLARLADEAFLVKGNLLTSWPREYLESNESFI